MEKIKTIIGKEWAEVFKNKLVLFTVAFLPLLLVAMPLIMLPLMGSETEGMSEMEELVLDVGHYPGAIMRLMLRK
jgi:hypothetical protein